MKNKGIGSSVVVVIVIVIVAVVAAGGYMLMSGDNGDNGEGGPTNGDGESLVWSDVSSLDIDLEVSDENGNIRAEGSIKMKGINTSQVKMRQVITSHQNGEEIEQRVIVNQELEDAWLYSQGEWYSVDNIPQMDYESLQSNIEDTVDDLENRVSGWTEGEDITIEGAAGSTTRLFNIEVNVDLSDSLFEDPTT